MIERDLPAWFDEAKLGIFIHWTPAAVPAYAPAIESKFTNMGQPGFDMREAFRDNTYAEMYQNSMAIPDSPTAAYHAEHYGDLPYDAFVEQFRRHLLDWDPEPWAELFQRAGARYVVFVTKPEDGFLLWPSATPNPHKEKWQSERDVVGDLAAAVRAKGLRFGVYYCGGVDWTFGGLPITDEASLREALLQGDDYLAYADAHWRELVERYEPSLLWNDYGYPVAADFDSLFRAYDDRVPDGVVNDRFGSFQASGKDVRRDFVTVEYKPDYSDVPTEPKWEACRGIGSSFGYNREETDVTYQPSSALLRELLDVVARGGNLLLNVGPTAAGDIPWDQARRLLDIGWWLHVYGEAVYGTRPWAKVEGATTDGLPVRYTATADAVYAVVLGTPEADTVELDVRLDADAEVSLVGHPPALSHQPSDAGVRVALREQPDRQPAIAFRLSPPSSVRPA